MMADLIPFTAFETTDLGITLHHHHINSPPQALCIYFTPQSSPHHKNKTMTLPNHYDPECLPSTHSHSHSTLTLKAPKNTVLPLTLVSDIQKEKQRWENTELTVNKFWGSEVGLGWVGMTGWQFLYYLIIVTSWSFFTTMIFSLKISSYVYDKIQ